MGHLVRQLAISKEFEDAVILTLSGAAPLALEHGVRLEYCPSYSRMDKRTWHRGYLRDRIIALAEEVKADAIVFDGVVPYVGLVNALQRLNLPAVWMRRGLWRPSAKTWPLKYSSVFDLVIEPDDIGRARDSGPTRDRQSVKVGVITEAGKMLERVVAAQALGVDPHKPTLLFNIGSNRGLDLQAVERFLANESEWNVISTSDALGRERSTFEIHKVSGLFPLHPYLAAIDLAVTSVGYNAAHEFTACHVPTIVMPADNATDDQYARADAMVALGISLRADTPDQLVAALSQWMSDPKARQEAALAAQREAATWSAGAREAADAIRGTRRRAHSVPARLWLRNGVERLLAVLPVPSTTPIFTEQLTPDLVRGEQPVEHLLAGSSESYRNRRRELGRSWLEK